MIKVALVGNPNTGKTTIFNNILNSMDYTANYPGATVELKKGVLEYKNTQIEIVDLPGVYSIEGYSRDEKITRDYLLNQNIDVILNIIDSTNLERNLFLSTQLLDLEKPVLFILNMTDELNEKHIEINADKMSNLLKAPIILNSAINMENSKILDEIIKSYNKKNQNSQHILFGEDIEKVLENIYSIIKQDAEIAQKYPKRILMLELIKKNSEILNSLQNKKYFSDIFKILDKAKKHLEIIYNENINFVISDKRYGFAKGLCSEIVNYNYEKRLNITEQIDKIMLNDFWGLPILMLFSYLLFKITFSISEPFVLFIETIIEKLALYLSNILEHTPIFKSLIVDGIVAGVGNVLVFVPVIFFLFLMIAILEGSGYMTRGVFIIDKFMHKIGLHGRSFIPMILGFGCNVPAIMSTRTIKSTNERLITILINPFMSCGARIPVYLLFINTFFAYQYRSIILFSIYLIGIIIGIITAKLLRNSVLKDDEEDFIMELPPYRMIRFKNIFLYSIKKVQIYIQKIGTVILFGSIIFWILTAFPIKNNEIANIDESYSAKIGTEIVPLFKPIGIEDWRLPVSFISGFVAKEMIVSTLATLYAVSDESDHTTFKNRLLEITKKDGSNQYTPFQVIIILLFVLLYIPCLGTMIVIWKETASIKWTLFSLIYPLLTAWTLCFVIYQIRNLF